MPLFTIKDAEDIKDPHGPHLSLWSTVIPTRQFIVKVICVKRRTMCYRLMGMRVQVVKDTLGCCSINDEVLLLLSAHKVVVAWPKDKKRVCP